MRELVLHCREAQAEAFSDALLEAGALSVSVEDADEGTAGERPLFGEPGTEPHVQAWDRNRVVVLLPDGADPAQLLEAALDYAGLEASLGLDWSLRDVPDADWVRLTQSQFGPIEISQRFWIIPSWHKVVDPPTAPDGLPPPEGARPDLRRSDAGPAYMAPGVIRIELDPGQAERVQLGSLAKVLITSGRPGLFERMMLRLSLLLRSHQ